MTFSRDSPASPSSDELELEALEQCRAGGIDGLEMLYKLHSQRVFRTCLRVLGDRSEAEDATQEVFLRVHAKASHFDRRSAFTTWLYRLSVNHCLNLLRNRGLLKRRLQPLESLENAVEARAGDCPEAALAQRESADLVQSLLARLSPEHRAAIVLRDIEGLTYREIADVLRIPGGTVMSRLHRARHQLKELLAKKDRGSVRAFPVIDGNAHRGRDGDQREEAPNQRSREVGP